MGIKNTIMSSFNDGMDDLVIGNGTNGTSPGMTIYSNSSDIGSISFRDSADTGISGLIQYRHMESPPYMRFMVENSNIAKFTTSGLCFGSDTAAANALDDYEEGSWTPTVTQGTIQSANCSYTKVGRLVTIQGKIDQFSNNSNSSSVQIGNLPFSSTVTNVAVGSVMYKYVGVAHATVLYITSNSLLEMYGGSSGDWSYISYNGLNVSSGATAMYFIATYQAS